MSNASKGRKRASSPGGLFARGDGAAEEYVTTAEASRILNVVPSRIRQLVGEGRVRVRMLGVRAYLVLLSDVMEHARTRRPGRPRGA